MKKTGLSFLIIFVLILTIIMGSASAAENVNASDPTTASFILDGFDIKIRIGSTFTPEDLNLSFDASDSGVMYESSEKNVLSVTDGGKITAVSEGTAVLTVHGPGGESTEYSVEVIVPRYTIAFRGNGGTGSMTELKNRIFGEKYTLPASVYKRAGYTFAGWNTRANCSGTPFSDREVVKNLTGRNGASVTLYAQWTPILYDIKFNANGGTGTMSALSNRKFGGKYTLPACAYKRTGYVFSGWNTRANGSGTAISDREIVKNLTGRNGASVTLYAQWTPISYDIRFNANGGTGTMSALSNRKFGGKYTLPACAYKRTGYVFSGWNTRANGSGTSFGDKEVVKNLTGRNGAAVTLYAQWKNDLPLKGYVIGLDPGHQAKGDSSKEPVAPGSSTMKKKVSSGTRGDYSGVYEYKVNLDVALLLRDMLEDAGAEVVMTHDTADVNVSNIERAKIFNRAKTDYALRIHCNGTEDHSKKGAFIIVPSSNPYLSDCKRAADLLIDEYCRATDFDNRGTVTYSDQTGFNWCERMIINIEMGHMSNKHDDLLLTDPDYQHKMAQGIFNGILRYFRA